MRVPEPAEDFLLRVDDVEQQLRGLVDLAPAPHALTAPDQPSGEQWDWGQVWAHLAEFVPYWMAQIKRVVDANTDRPVPFGRVKTDPGRVQAIEADRHTPPPELMERLAGQLRDLRVLLADLSPEDWQKQGTHPTLGVMSLEKIVDEFLVKHIEDHADQLDQLVRA
jgi:hypothetical protein